MYTILCNMKGSRKLSVDDSHLMTIDRYSLFSDLLDSNGIVEESVLEKLRLNVRSLLANEPDPELLDFCERILFHNDMKAFGLHQLILLYIDWKREQP
ncbi:MAG: hypothetical protein IKQ07_08270 [Bacteroidaceae bacterium]|nr:hypothetical protein [Bacteroidaceae bacterium]MBR6129608.1 hypothetical protein [Bacteroidaceae bacterium]